MISGKIGKVQRKERVPWVEIIAEKEARVKEEAQCGGSECLS